MEKLGRCSTLKIKTFLKNNAKSYLLVCAFGMLAGVLVMLFSNMPSNTLWSLSSFSSATIGFWMCTTSIIALVSDKPLVAGINASLYVGIMFAITGIFKKVREINSEYCLEINVVSSTIDVIFYSIFPAVICGVFGVILWNGRREKWFGKVLLVLPLIFISAEAVIMYARVFTEGRMLFQALLDTGCATGYFLFIKSSLFP